MILSIFTELPQALSENIENLKYEYLDTEPQFKNILKAVRNQSRFLGDNLDGVSAGCKKGIYEILEIHDCFIVPV